MNDPNKREYKINIDPRILELLGPSLYTNIYFVLAELIANAYDANASNVYIIQKADRIIVEDDGTGMSYEKGDIEKYLNVAVETRTSSEDSYTVDRKRKRMGRKGVGKLAALSVSENVQVMTSRNNEKSGFILSRHINADHILEPLEEKDIKFERITSNGTAIVMADPHYGLHKTSTAIKNNLLKIFPLVNSEFVIHIITEKEEIKIDSFDKEIVQGLGALILLGKEFHSLSNYYDCGLSDRKKSRGLLKQERAVHFRLKLVNKKGISRNYDLEIKGWIGAYKTTRGRKIDSHDFPDNFISLLSNKKLGEYNILPLVGKNRLPEVYIVGQLHVDLFEETELPDMALSNRQGYKTDDPRYECVINYVRLKLLPAIVGMRVTYAVIKKAEKDMGKHELQKQREEELRRKVHEYKDTAAARATELISAKYGGTMPKGIREIIANQMNEAFPILGIKREVDAQKKRILISHTAKDKVLCDVIYNMLSFNNVPDEDIIYTNCDSAECRIPEGVDIFEYLRAFFVDSFSTEKIYVIYVTSQDMEKSWGAVTEVGAGWITKSDHKVFNISGCTPRRPLNTDVEWHTSQIAPNDNITMNAVNFDKFIVKILNICTTLQYKVKDKDANKIELLRHVSIK